MIFHYQTKKRLRNYFECCVCTKYRYSSFVVRPFVRGSLGLTEKEIKPYKKILLSGRRFGEEDLSVQIEEKRRIIRKSQFLEFWDTRDLPDDIGGMDSLKMVEQRSMHLPKKPVILVSRSPKAYFPRGTRGGKSLMAKVVKK